MSLDTLIHTPYPFRNNCLPVCLSVCLSARPTAMTETLLSTSVSPPHIVAVCYKIGHILLRFLQKCLVLCYYVSCWVYLSLFFRRVLSNNISVVIDVLLVKDVVLLFLRLFFTAGKGIVRHPSLQIAIQVILFLLLISSYGFDSLLRGFADEEYSLFLLISVCSDTWYFQNYFMILRILTK